MRHKVKHRFVVTHSGWRKYSVIDTTTGEVVSKWDGIGLARLNADARNRAERKARNGRFTLGL